MTATRRPTMRQTWTAAGDLGDPPVTAFIRAGLVTGLLALLIPVALVALVVALVLRSNLLAAVSLLAVAAFFASAAVKDAFRIRLRRRTDLDGKPVQPARLGRHMAMQGFILASHALFAVGSAWVALNLLG